MMIAFTVVVLIIGFLMVVPYITRCRTFDKAPVAEKVFLAHWVENWTFYLKFGRWQYLHNEPNAAKLPWWLEAFAKSHSVASLLSPHAYEVVDNFDFKGKRIETWLVNAYHWHFTIPPKYGGLLCLMYVRWKMKRAVAAAHQKGVKLMGLGAATKDHQLTKDGGWYVEQLDESRPRLAHGDTLTVAAQYRRVMQLVDQVGARSVFLTGATSKIGRALAIRLAGEGVDVYLHTNHSKSESLFADIQAEAGVARSRLHYAPTLDRLRACRICVTGKSSDGLRLLQAAAPGTAFVNFAVPDPFTPEMLEGKEFYHYDGGLLDYSNIPNNLRFAMRLVSGKYTYACHAWLLTAAVHDLCSDELGQVKVGEIDLYWQLAEEAGFALPEPTSFHYPVALPEVEGPVRRHITPKPPLREKEAA